MKNIIIYSLILVFNSAFTVKSFAQEVKSFEVQTSAQCEMCKDRLEKNLAFERGINSVELDMETKKLNIRYTIDKTNEVKIKNIISSLGYDADDVKADTNAYNKLPMCCKKPEDRKKI
jgi:copper chaperone CopZ